MSAFASLSSHERLSVAEENAKKNSSFIKSKKTMFIKSKKWEWQVAVIQRVFDSVLSLFIFSIFYLHLFLEINDLWFIKSYVYHNDENKLCCLLEN